MNGLVLDVEGANRSPGARVITWSQKFADNDNQLWYDDPATGIIRSKMNDFCLDFSKLLTVMLYFTFYFMEYQQIMQVTPKHIVNCLITVCNLEALACFILNKIAYYSIKQ